MITPHFPCASPRHLILLACLSLLSCGLSHAAPQTRLLVDLSSKPATLGLCAFDLCVLQVDAQVNLEAAHALGNKCLARIPIFEVADHSPAAVRAEKLGVPLLEGSVKGRSRLDATHPRWSSVVVHELVENAAERGFDGVVLAELETISQDAERAAVLEVLMLLKATYPDKLLFLENGFDLVTEARRSLDGILLIEQAGSDEAPRLERRIQGAARLGVQPYVLAFADPEKLADIAVRTARFRELGGIPFFTTAALEGVNLGPLHEISRRVLVLHSGVARESFTARVLHGSLEWLGYQMIYQDAGTACAADLLPAHIGVNGVILDQSLKLNGERQKNLADLILNLAEQKVPLLLTGMPWQNEADLKRIMSTLGLHGSGKLVTELADPSFLKREMGMLLDPNGLSPRIQDLRDMMAPAGARVIMSIQAGDRAAGSYDQVFLTNWGGVWLDPLASEVGPQVSPLPFLENWLAGQALAPVADTTCLDGRRLLVSHVSAEGFAETTNLPGLPIAAEAMCDRILKRYALPFSVAVCEGDLRGWTPGHEPRQSLRLMEAARTVFELPQVESASYSFSRPDSWKDSLAAAGTLNASAVFHLKGFEREVMGSLAFIHRQFLGNGSTVALMNWPQGSSPSREAVAYTRSLGVENIELVTRDVLPGRVSAPAARTWGSGVEFQTLLNSTRTGKKLDSAAAIIAAQQLHHGRWMSPIEAILSFKDAQTEGSFKQVESYLNWCASQPLQAISAGQYARLSRDAAQTRFFQTGPARWIIVNAGQARTLRLPARAGVPDLALCTGVAGYMKQGDQIYIHTLGLRRTELVMRAESVREHLRLSSSSSSVRYLETASSRALLQVSHSRPVEMTFDGILPGSICQMIANGKPEYLMADISGRIDFIVPSQATVQLRILPSHQSAMR